MNDLGFTQNVKVEVRKSWFSQFLAKNDFMLSDDKKIMKKFAQNKQKTAIQQDSFVKKYMKRSLSPKDLHYKSRPDNIN